MTKKELISSLAASAELTHNDIAKVLKGLTDVCLDELKTNKSFVLNDMVRLRLVDKPALPARQMKSPATGQMISVPAKPASKKLKVTVAKQLRDLVKG